MVKVKMVKTPKVQKAKIKSALPRGRPSQGKQTRSSLEHRLKDKEM
jgi:hypothetical protein